MYGCQQVLIKSSNELAATLEFICSEANKLTNCGIYLARQVFLKTGKIISKFDLHKEYKQNKHFQALYSQAAQQVLTTVGESFQSFKQLRKAHFEGKIKQKPRLPNYRKKGGLTLLAYPKQHLKLINGQIRIPLGSLIKTWFGIDSFTIPMPSNLDYLKIKELRILPRNGCFYAEFIYKLEASKPDLDYTLALGIDHGIDNWLTCISNAGTSLIVDGRKVKSLNQWYNKEVARLKTNQPQGFWSKKLAYITEKRNRQVRDAVNKTARIVINHCLENKIGNVVFGWNQRHKDSIELGRRNNQTIVQIPTARLKARIKQLCELYSIKFHEVEESYTSQSSFLDGDTIPKFCEKPEGWVSSGKRVKRGLFVTATGKQISADLNASANMLIKVSTQLNIILDLAKVVRGLLTVPPRIFLWEKNCKTQKATVLTSLFVTV
ncbi:RNA-guided endonuclease TnpB family protein [Nostoc sp. PCC 7524]|uniref:RNA-guided endonuclease InsQ/TnpB family protein n=1 Tax=Nostoc sp. (strain ATCC 29411 / PCC 7524) TaxID=28072 RepID=UPI000684EDAE